MHHRSASKKFLAIYAVAGIVAFFSGCADDNAGTPFNPNKNFVEAEEIEPEKFRLPATMLVLSLYSANTFKEFNEANAGQKPLLAVGAVANETGFIFNPEVLSKDIAAIIAAGRRARVMGFEKPDDAGTSDSPFGNVIPDFTITGKITGNEEPELSLTLTDMKTGGVVWSESRPVKR